MNKRRLLFWGALITVFTLPPLFFREAEPVAYPAPRFPREVLLHPTDQELEKIADFIAHQTSGPTRIGTVLPGQKLLTVTDRSQDMRLLQAVIKAMRRRDVQMDYIFEDDLMEQMLGVKKKARPGSAAVRRQKPRWELGWEAPWPRFLPEPLRREVIKIKGGADRLNAGTLSPLQEAMRRYMELHPGYDAVVGGDGRQEYIRINVGPQFKSLWDYTSVRIALVDAAVYPTDVWRLTEDKIMQTVPWIEEVHVYDPEGTDLRFSVTPEEAEIWAKGAFQPNHLFLYPLQGSRAVYWREGIRKVVVPDANGVVAATHSNSGVYPNMKVYVENGLVTHVEGGGKYKEVWDAFLANERLSSAEIPLLGKKGYLYLYEISWGANPKVVRDYYQTPVQDNGRSGVFHWGFGVEMGNPEIVDYLQEQGLPNDHGFHMKTYFTTYEVKLRGTNQWLKFVNKGRLYHLDDPEVRALASRYGNAEEILRERWIPDFPGINAPGDYQDFARDPAPYVTRAGDLVEEGTYPYLQ